MVRRRVLPDEASKTESNFFLILLSSNVSEAMSAIVVRSMFLESCVIMPSVVWPNEREVKGIGEVGGLAGVNRDWSWTPKTHKFQ